MSGQPGPPNEGGRTPPASGPQGPPPGGGQRRPPGSQSHPWYGQPGPPPGYGQQPGPSPGYGQWPSDPGQQWPQPRPRSSQRSVLAMVGVALALLAALAAVIYGGYAAVLRRGVFADLADDAGSVSADTA